MSQNEVGKIYERPWGTYQTLVFGHGFQVKVITVNPGGKLSLQRHFKRAEHWVITQGTPLVTVGEDTQRYQPDQAIYIPIESLHRIYNDTDEACVFVEVQIGSYLGEDDIERVEDIYNR